MNEMDILAAEIAGLRLELRAVALAILSASSVTYPDKALELYERMELEQDRADRVAIGMPPDEAPTKERVQ